MYIVPTFRMDRAASLAFAAARGFGLVVAAHAGRPVASALPFVLSAAADGSPVLQFHVAAGNPLAGLAARGGTWLVAISGDDAYVSPDWYASPDQVPTWLYELVQLSGPVRVLSLDERREHLERLTDRFEDAAGSKPAWSVRRVTPARREALTQAICAIEMSVETIDGSAKLNQSKSDADQIGVVAGLACQDQPSARAIAARMIELRPHLTYA